MSSSSNTAVQRQHNRRLLHGAACLSPTCPLLDHLPLYLTAVVAIEMWTARMPQAQCQPSLAASPRTCSCQQARFRYWHATQRQYITQISSAWRVPCDYAQSRHPPGLPRRHVTRQLSSLQATSSKTTAEPSIVQQLPDSREAAVSPLLLFGTPGCQP